MVDKGVAALGKVALRNRESLCLLRASGESLVLEILHWPDEIREQPDVHADKSDIDEKQLKMAESLIDLMVDDFK
ncbi:Ku protein, partial [Enterococcus faecium]